jgi:hypothetical protein
LFLSFCYCFPFLSFFWTSDPRPHAC